MGDIDVDFFLGTLKNLITDSKINYITDQKNQLESLAGDIKYLREFLKLTEKKRKEHPEVMNLVMRIRDVVSETENIVELLVVRAYQADHSGQDDYRVRELGSLQDSVNSDQDDISNHSVHPDQDDIPHNLHSNQDDISNHSIHSDQDDIPPYLHSNQDDFSNHSVHSDQDDIPHYLHSIDSDQDDIPHYLHSNQDDISKLSIHSDQDYDLSRYLDRDDISLRFDPNDIYPYAPYRDDGSDQSDRDDISLDLESVKKEIMTLRVEVECILDKDVYDINGVAVTKCTHSSTESEGGPNPSGGRDTYKVSEEREVVGFEDEARTLMGKLHDSGDGGNLEIISIIGVGGGGKTTLAKEVYLHPLTLEKFEIRAWVTVSQDYNKTMKRDLLISILKSASPKDQEDYKEMNEDMLGEHVNKCLKGKKYLVVMDDIWGLEAWNDIQRSFPRGSNQSKLLLTSRQLVQPDGIGFTPHFINLLSYSCSWELLQKKVFKKGQCPLELVNIGMQIAKKSGGLPLAIVAIAGILAKEDKTIKVWEEVAEHLSSIIANSQDGTMEILELSYNHLPLHLKACFLYIGAHHEDYEIPVRKLIWLWIAEGFIHQIDGVKSLEAIAKDLLIDLIERNLIMVAKKNEVGTIKACRIHDLLRELCFTKGKEDNFFGRNYNDDPFSPVTNKSRRIFIGNELFDKFYSSSSAGNLRSFLCFKVVEAEWGKKNYRANQMELSVLFAKRFKLLRVLHAMNLANIGKLQKGHLVHLRYLALDVGQNSMRLWPFLCNLSNLETLELYFQVYDILLPLDVFKMVRLRNLYGKPGCYTFHHSFKGGPDEIRDRLIENEEDLEILRPYFKDKGEDFEIFRRFIAHEVEDYGGQGFEILNRYCDEEGGDSYEDEGEENKLESLQILYSICGCKYCLRFLKRAPNLRDLSIVEKKVPAYDLFLYNLEFLESLEILYLYGDNDYFSRQIATVELKLPPTITRLALSRMRVKWEHLSILLETLQSLEVLKLTSNYNMGRCWDTSELEKGFSQLKYLKLYDLDIEEWTASEDNFPGLEVLVIKGCKSLQGIPIEFGELYELREITVRYSTISAEESAREIQEAQENSRGDACNLVAEHNHPDDYLGGYSSDSSMD